MKERLQQRVHELDPLPELLRTNELKLQDASERSALLEKRNAELQRNIQELNDKVREEWAIRVGGQHFPKDCLCRLQLTQHMDLEERTREKMHALQDENRQLISRIESLEKCASLLLQILYRE